MKEQKLFGNKRQTLCLLIIYAICNSMIAILISLFAKRLINTIAGIDKLTSKVLLVFLGAVVIIFISFFFSKYFLLSNGFKSVSRIQTLISEHINKIDLRESQELSKGEIFTCITEDIKVIANFLQNDLIDFFETVLMFVSMSILSIILDWRVYIFTMACSLVYSMTLLFAKKIEQYDVEIRLGQKELMSKSLHIFRSLPIFHFFSGCNELVVLFKEQAREVTEKKIDRIKLNGIYLSLSVGSNMLREIGIIMICPLVFKLDLGTTMAFINISSYLNSTLAGIGEGIINYRRVKVSHTNVQKVLSMPVEELGTYNKKQFEILEFKNVSFSYLNKNKIINNFSLKIRNGEMIGITGEIGSGKSTLFKLLSGLYFPQTGEILLNNVAVTKNTALDLRQMIAYVDQDANLFEDTLRENLRCYDVDISDEVIMDALKKAELAEWFNKFPDGLSTILGKGGIPVSGGERQRISIIRAILNRSPILLIDEPTANLDSDNELLIREFINSEKGKRTIIIISHGKECLSDMERVFILDKGNIAETMV